MHNFIIITSYNSVFAIYLLFSFFSLSRFFPASPSCESYKNSFDLLATRCCEMIESKPLFFRSLHLSFLLSFSVSFSAHYTPHLTEFGFCLIFQPHKIISPRLHYIVQHYTIAHTTHLCTLSFTSQSFVDFVPHSLHMSIHKHGVVGLLCA